jgi:hypothetical protein
MGVRVAGICYIKADGVQLAIKSDSGMEIPFNQNIRETVMGLDAPAGFSEKAQRPSIKGTFIFVPDFPVQTLNTMTNGTITAELANGQIYTLTGAWMEGEIMADGIAGEIPIEFSGINGIWNQ